MANIAHAALTGSELHEPKGVENASLGEVYVANGNGSGNWSNVGTSSFTGMIADFTWPIVQEGWLECDGSDINTTTYGGLYSVMTIQMNGTRVSGSSTITSLSSTANMRVGYYVFGTGIAAGTTISAINSSTQITLSNNASSSGTALIVVSPWYLNTGTIRLPDLSTAGRYRRSRTSSTSVGQLQDSQNKSHAHTGSGTTSGQSSDHSHYFSYTGGTETMNQNVSHTHTTGTTGNAYQVTELGGPYASPNGSGGQVTGSTNIDHNHYFTVAGWTGGTSVGHTHTYSLTTSSEGSSEARPSSIVLMTCVKT